MWDITALDYEAPLFSNAEAREGAGVNPALWAKWTQRGLVTPSRMTKSGRAGPSAGKKIFEMRVLSIVVEGAAIPVSEAQQIAALAAKGPWNAKDLAAEPSNWRSVVLRASPPPLDVFLVFSKIDNCWGYEASLGPPKHFKHSASIVLAAKRELETVSKYCWGILHETGKAKE